MTNGLILSFKAADFLAATAAIHSLDTSFPIYQVRGVTSDRPDGGDSVSPPNVKYVFIGVVIVLLAGLLIGVLVTAQRKRAVGITWFPEGFLRNNSGPRRRSRRRGPDGQEMRNLNKQASVGCMDVDMGGVGNGGMHTTIPGSGGVRPGTQWSDDECDLPPPKRIRACGDAGYASDHTVITDYEDAIAASGEPRMWSQQHLDAADIRTRPDQGILTPPSMEQHHEVDVQGPCGMTPLMVAAVRGGGIDTGEDEEDDQTAAVIADLVAHGQYLHSFHLIPV